MSKIISITTARKDIYTITDEIATKSTHYVLTEKGKGKVVMMSLEEFEAWQETLDVLKDFPEISKDILKTRKEFENKKTTTLSDYLKK